jgi:hypothetical protein
LLTRSNNQLGNYVLNVNCKSRYGVPELIVGSCGKTTKAMMPFLCISNVTNVQKMKSIDPCFFQGLQTPNEGINQRSFKILWVSRKIKKSKNFLPESYISGLQEGFD